MQLDIMLTNPLTKTIGIEKFGITIRPLSLEEKTSAIEKVDLLYFSKKAKWRIKKYVEFEHITSENYKMVSAYRSKLTEEESTACFLYCSHLKEGIQFKKSEVKKVLNQTAIIEVSNKFDEYIDGRYKLNIIIMLIKYMLYIKTDIALTDIKKEIVTAEEFSVLQTTDTIKYTARVFNYITNKENSILTSLDLMAEDFEMFSAFVNMLSKERIRDLYIIFDTLFAGNYAYENRIVFLVSIVERLLIKHDTNYDIGKQFTLKFGLLLKENTDYFKDVKFLNYCYAIRSCIVHGDDKKIVDLPKKYLKLSDEDMNALLEADSHYTKKERALFLCIMYLEKNIRVALSAWTSHTEKIEYLKEN